jgi:hypothetical protein
MGRKLICNNVIASVAKQSSEANARLDCFVASLLAMTQTAPGPDDGCAFFPSNSRCFKEICMKRKSVLNGTVPVCALAAFLGAALLFTACPADGGDEPTHYTATFTVGAGSGTPPAPMTVASGTAITLPEQGEMIPPEDTVFDGWKSGETSSAAGASFTVTANTLFTAQWTSGVDPNKTYIAFNNPEQFPAIIYADPSRQTEAARVPAGGTARIETESRLRETAFYPRFLLDIEGITITQDSPAIAVRIDERKVNNAPIPALAAIETGFAYIRIENSGAYSFTLNRANYELPPLNAASTLVMPGETGTYQIEPESVGLCKVMRSGSVPLDFPPETASFNRGVIYTFVYTGSSLTLRGADSILQTGTPLAPAWINAEAKSWNSIGLTWEEVCGATSYKLYRATGSGSLEPLHELKTTAYTDTGLRSNTAYTYQVSALSNKSGEGPASANGLARTGELPAELRPTVSGAAEMEAVLALINTGEYAEWIITVEGGFSLSSPVSLNSRSEPADIRITGGGGGEQLISLQSLLIESGVSLTVEGAVTLKGLNSGERLVVIKSGGAFTLEEEAAVRDNTGGGVYVDGGTLTMNGGAISGNAVSSTTRNTYGGGVYLNGGTFTMNGGVVGNNSASTAGGGVYLNGGTFAMSDGTISGNSASSRGGGVYSSGGTVTVSGGAISGNSGGGVYSSGGTVTMSGGAISGNTNSSGGGVSVISGTFTMSGGTISGNTASTNGGGVFASSGTFTMSGGEIGGNTASANGGGVYAGPSGTFTKQSGGVIYGGSDRAAPKNSASYGSAVYVSKGNASYERNRTAGEDVSLDSGVSGRAGGWEQSK